MHHSLVAMALWLKVVIELSTTGHLDGELAYVATVYTASGIAELLGA